ncbi:MAG: hypothetical protein H5U37_01210 [Caldisericia bacterium]|nr:hypothetical protein [Caldisericia bacterium]
MKRNIFIEGEIKSGKSYILNSILRKLNINYGGFITYPFYENSLRLGFKIKDILTQEEEICAIHNSDGNLIIFKNAFDNLGVNALNNALLNSELIVMDELGFLEEVSKKFKDKVIEVLNREKIVIGVIKEKKNSFLNEISKMGKIYKVSFSNKEEIINEIVKEVSNWISMKI